MALRLQKIDDTNRHDHFYLDEEDECYFLYEYTARAGWQGGATNQLIHNLQKKKGDGGYHYKAPAIAKCAAAFSETISGKWLDIASLIPVPPSKIKSDPGYDDRISQICRAIRYPAAAEVRDVIEQIISTDRFKAGNRKSPPELCENYRVVPVELAQMRRVIGIVDDVLTTGSHFKAVKSKIIAERADTKVVGFFVARRVIPNPFADVSMEELLS